MYFNSWGEPTSLAWNLKTISMRLEEWKTFSEKHSFLTFGGEVMASVQVSIRGYVRE